jgi:hypothetical protein
MQSLHSVVKDEIMVGSSSEEESEDESDDERLALKAKAKA